jgi:archaellum component FlaC
MDNGIDSSRSALTDLQYLEEKYKKLYAIVKAVQKEIKHIDNRALTIAEKHIKKIIKEVIA